MHEFLRGCPNGVIVIGLFTYMVGWSYLALGNWTNSYIYKQCIYLMADLARCTYTTSRLLTNRWIKTSLNDEDCQLFGMNKLPGHGSNYNNYIIVITHAASSKVHNDACHSHHAAFFEGKLHVRFQRLSIRM